MGLVENAGTVGAYLNKTMKQALADHPHVGEVRGEGLMCAVEFVDDKADRVFFDQAKKMGPALSAAALERGLITRAMPQGDILGFAPPLCVTKDEADTIVAKTVEAVKAVLG